MLESMNFQVIACDNYNDIDITRIDFEVILTDLCIDEIYGFYECLQLKRQSSTKFIHHVAISTPMVREEIVKFPEHMQPDEIILMPISRIGLYRAMRSLFWNKFKEPTVIQRS